jgi:hypothetical protein
MSEEKRWQKEVFRVLDVSKCMMQERRKRERKMWERKEENDVCR